METPELETPKRLVMRSYLVASNSASNHPVGTVIELKDAHCSYPDQGGWKSVVEFQHDRLLHYLGHYREWAVPIPNGIKVMERWGSYGFKYVMECTIE